MIALKFLKRKISIYDAYPCVTLGYNHDKIVLVSIEDFNSHDFDLPKLLVELIVFLGMSWLLNLCTQDEIIGNMLLQSTAYPVPVGNEYKYIISGHTTIGAWPSFSTAKEFEIL